MTFVKFNNNAVEKSLSHLMEDFFKTPSTINGDVKSRNSVPVNIKETESAFILDLIAPGMDKNDFNVSLDKNLVTITGERKSQAKDELEQVVRKEYNFLSFKRTFTIDDKIDASNIQGKYENGILTLNFPKRPEVKASTKEIPIQ